MEQGKKEIIRMKETEKGGEERMQWKLEEKKEMETKKKEGNEDEEEVT
jgi:hypothetical protein